MKHKKQSRKGLTSDGGGSTGGGGGKKATGDDSAGDPVAGGGGGVKWFRSLPFHTCSWTLPTHLLILPSFPLEIMVPCKTSFQH